MMGMPHGANVAAQPASGLSRYRSLRDGVHSRQSSEAPNGSTAHPPARAQSSTTEQNPSIARSMSRYRRARPSANGKLPPARPTPAILDQHRSHPAEGLPGDTRGTGEYEHRSTRHAGLDSENPGMVKSTPTDENELAKERHRQNAMAQLTGEYAPTSSEPSRSQRPGESAQQRPKPRNEQHEGDRQAATSAHAAVPDASRKSFLQKVKLSRPKEPAKPDHLGPRYMDVGGGGMIGGVDAPISAVNAGERRVTVQYGDGATELAVTPSTQVEDILMSAARYLSSEIDPGRFILMESFQQLGLERPLRRYERVRDVMNSWAADGDNRLIIIPPSSTQALTQLDVEQVSSERPAETTVYLYHSQRPRKWDKRYVTLRSDGQVTISKKPDAKESANICHLSDFDIYYPNAQALAKDIKPPKKICYAIKSQQKSSMFLSTENFVHFFTTNDRSVADSWYQAAQKWRSWYLVNKLGAGQKAEKDTALLSRSGTRKSSRRQQNDSPLDRDARDVMHVSSSVDQSRPTNSKELFTRKKSLRENVRPPSSYPKILTVNTGSDSDKGSLVQGMSPEAVDAATFSPTGLLGRTYSQRQRSMREREETEERVKQDPFGPHGFLAGCSPSHPASQQHSRSNTINQAATVSVNRSRSVTQQPKPLVDLAPVSNEPPQYTRKGRGVRMEPGMPLIDGATGPELSPGSVVIPPATPRRHPASSVPGRSNTVRSTHHASQSHVTSLNAAVPSLRSPQHPFMPNSLLSSPRMPNGQGMAATGRGVATGDRNATRPMLDLSPDSPFAEGSLLRQL